MTTNAQRQAIADAYNQAFPPGAATTAILDDLTLFAKSLPDPLMRAGATDLILHLLLRRSLLRRERARG